VRFLLDENLSPDLKPAMHRLDAGIDVVRIGDEGMPAFGTLDPDILLFSEQSQRMLVTDNRRSMPLHLQTHHRAGHHHWGVLWIRPDTPLGRLAAELHVVWGASEAEEWLDRVRWFPL
jgi:hypothetical protein